MLKISFFILLFKPFLVLINLFIEFIFFLNFKTPLFVTFVKENNTKLTKVFLKDGTIKFYKNFKLHRECGLPAVLTEPFDSVSLRDISNEEEIRQFKSIKYFINGKEVTKEDSAKFGLKKNVNNF